MTDPGTPTATAPLETLEPLEPLDAGVPGRVGGAGDDPLLQAMRSGLPAPAFNPYCRDKTFYKFLFAGVVMLLGCTMPFNANVAVAGYQTMSGACYTLIAIGMVWTWWGAIACNRSTNASLKWLGLSFLPFVAILMNMIAFVPADALAAAAARGWLPADAPVSAGWKELFADMGSALAKNAEAAARVEHFWRLFGTGQVFVFLGAVLAEMGFIGGVLGGAKKNKQEKQQKQMAAAERKRR